MSPDQNPRGSQSQGPVQALGVTEAICLGMGHREPHVHRVNHGPKNLCSDPKHPRSRIGLTEGDHLSVIEMATP